MRNHSISIRFHFLAQMIFSTAVFTLARLETVYAVHDRGSEVRLAFGMATNVRPHHERRANVTDTQWYCKRIIINSYVSLVGEKSVLRLQTSLMGMIMRLHHRLESGYFPMSST